MEGEEEIGRGDGEKRLEQNIAEREIKKMERGRKRWLNRKWKRKVRQDRRRRNVSAWLFPARGRDEYNNIKNKI